MNTVQFQLVRCGVLDEDLNTIKDTTVLDPNTIGFYCWKHMHLLRVIPPVGSAVAGKVVHIGPMSHPDTIRCLLDVLFDDSDNTKPCCRVLHRYTQQAALCGYFRVVRLLIEEYAVSPFVLGQCLSDVIHFGHDKVLGYAISLGLCDVEHTDLWTMAAKSSGAVYVMLLLKQQLVPISDKDISAIRVELEYYRKYLPQRVQNMEKSLEFALDYKKIWQKAKKKKKEGKTRGTQV